ncbi:MAG: hypothetical protein CBD16_09555 [Betaproteobacteria bacterium TMED156]|nr:MAG: hypothetical protein CBD16_09555 [Betaproteobacteria bacterium TMED156]|tara:strand:+ start:271 stop:720 length:450 start_codon:yes stop_codon:yes gene_type:complete
MASTVSKAIFTSKITESITLNNHPKKLETTLTIPDVTDYSHRIMSVAVAGSSILTLGAADAAGALDKARFKYMRITNLDDTNDVRLTVELTTAQDTYEVVLGPKASQILTSKSGDITTGGAAVTLEDITSVKGTATTAACDVEIFTVST